MTMLSVKLARALERGRAVAPRANRAQLLATLLRKRAAAHNAGAHDLEAMLRDQIRWSLPIEHDPEQRDGAADPEVVEGA